MSILDDYNADPIRLSPKITNDRQQCRNGHEMTKENTVYRMGIRGCRLCIRDRKKLARARFAEKTGG